MCKTIEEKIDSYNYNTASEYIADITDTAILNKLIRQIQVQLEQLDDND